MGKFDGILICTDLDGTLFRRDKTVSRENLEAIEYFKSEGGYFTFVTGRPPYHVSEVYGITKPNAPICCVNGGGIYDYENRRYLYLKTLPREAIELVRYADEHIEGIGIQLNTPDLVYSCRENKGMVLFRKMTNTPYRPRNYGEVDEDLIKAVFVDLDESHILRLEELLGAHPRAEEFEFIRTERILYEMLPRGINKGAGLVRLADILGVSIERTVAVGDYYNDVEMIRAAGVGVAVANAVDEVKAVADHITVSNEEHAIAKVISDIERGALGI